MSGHALMGRPATRLEKMGFVDKLVCLGRCFRWKGITFPVWVQFIKFIWWYFRVPYRNHLLGIKCYSTYDSTYKHTVVGILPNYHISYNKYHSSTDTIVPAESSHWHHCSSGIFQYQLFQPYIPLSFDKI